MTKYSMSTYLIWLVLECQICLKIAPRVLVKVLRIICQKKKKKKKKTIVNKKRKKLRKLSSFFSYYINIQGCALAVPKSPWHTLFTLEKWGNHSEYFTGSELWVSLRYKLEHSLVTIITPIIMVCGFFNTI